MGGVYRLIGAQLRIEVDGMVGMEVLVVFPFFFFFWTKLETSFRGNEGKIGRRKSCFHFGCLDQRFLGILLVFIITGDG